jgi:hypothetical protein
MSDITIKTWRPTNQLYGQPMGISELAYCNGIYLAHTDEHPDGSECFKTNIISTDFEYWQHRPSSPDYQHKLSDVKITSTDDKFIAVASRTTDTGKKFIAYNSTNGFDWLSFYESDDESDNYIPLSISVVTSRIVIGCSGVMFTTSDGLSWSKLTLPEEFSKADILGSAVAGEFFYFLLKQDNKSYIASTTNGVDFDVNIVPWGMETVAIAGNGSQVVLSGRTNKHACLIFFSDSIDSYSLKSIPIELVDDCFSTIYDMLWHDNQWIFVGAREFYTSSKLKFSNGGYVFRVKGNLSEDSDLIQDTISTRSLNKVTVVNNKLVVYGLAVPTADNCLYMEE